MLRYLRYTKKLLRTVVYLPAALQELSEKTSNISATQANLSRKVAKLETNNNQSSKTLENLNLRVTELAHQLLALEKRKTKVIGAPEPGSTLQANDHLLDPFYLEFENKFRGTEEEIKKRQTVYLKFFDRNKHDFKKHPVLDLGSGRGEFLNLLQEKNIRGVGLDLNLAMVNKVKKMGIEAHQQDAIEYLQTLPTASVSAITGFHLVEHIPFPMVMRLFSECYRTLTPNGFVIFETPNPENILVGACHFYADPSHLNPILPPVLEFALQTRGFKNTEIMRLHPVEVERSSNENQPPIMKDLEALLYSARDYSVIGYK